ncbi:pentatricopeptide repeat-containing protein At1g62720 [Selaginella moellendorffii]|uniref:pentatricopeptide repeat-containing protein At1g62720 n=1 Tax=Selaginella moellendorffii TaxID=88036 RepID=UPI000D1C76ED|nr:pentatricopeptide repeat-containing protein At1g62720 [Selaginella moellendorffii]|eukprot:XP_024525832.1 pentatricopeptide repeat-containing protein At1g62720 [Selaginella moellendorffii]
MALLAGAIPVAIASSSSTSLAPISCSAQAVEQNVSFRKNASATAAEEQIFSGQGPDPDAALAFFQWLTREACYNPNTVAYNCLLNTLVKAGRIYQVREMLDRKTLGEFVHSEFTYGTLVHGHCLAGEFDEAKRLVEEFKDTGMSPGSLVVLHSLMLKGFSEAGLVDEAKSYLHRMDCKPSSISYNTLIDALCSFGRI